MWNYIFRRLLILVPVIFGITVIVFSIIQFIPGDPVTIMFGRDPDPEAIELVRRQYHLDKPVLVQYLYWLGGLVRGDFGMSMARRAPVWDLIVERLPRTAILATSGVLVALLLGIPLGIITAVRRNTGWDLSLTSLALVSVSMPGFWKGILAILIFGVFLQWFPISGYSPIEAGVGRFLHHLVLPSLALGTGLAATTVRILRSSMLEVLRMDYITTARSKGLRERLVIYKHALRNALIPALTVVGIQIGYLFGGTIILERVFSYPGLGLQLLFAFNARDYPLIQGQILVFALMFLLINLATDIAYGVVNPRIRYG